SRRLRVRPVRGPSRTARARAAPERVLPAPGVRVLVLRGARPRPGRRGDRRRQPLLRDRLPAPHLPLRQRAREDRSVGRRAATRDPAQAPLGERGAALSRRRTGPRAGSGRRHRGVRRARAALLAILSATVAAALAAVAVP